MSENNKLTPVGAIMKITARCNLNCDYCYMFSHADKSFVNKKAVMAPEIFASAVDQLVDIAIKNDWDKVHMSLHGGEPLLAGKKYFQQCLSYLHAKKQQVKKVSVSVQTNGVLIDQDWLDIFSEFDVCVGISLDGPAAANDLHRLDHKGRSTYEKTVAAIFSCLEAGRQSKIRFGGILAVIDPRASGAEVFGHFVDKLGVRWMDFLLPDIHHDLIPTHYCNPPGSYARYLIEVFDAWWLRRDPTIEIRFLDAIIQLLLGGYTITESLKAGMGASVVIETDGSIEPLDVLRIASDGFTRQEMYIQKNELEAFFDSPLLKQLKASIRDLDSSCLSCMYKDICGGGYLPHRYSKARGFKNPSSYCYDLKQVLTHIKRTIEADAQQNQLLEVTPNATKYPTAELSYA